jgi:hypothetical protein
VHGPPSRLDDDHTLTPQRVHCNNIDSRHPRHSSAITMEDNANGPVFRATKRRKVFRKRADSNASGDEPHVASTIQDPDSTASPANGTSSTAEPHEDALSLSETTRVRRPKKHGIAFSSSDPNSSRPHNNNNEETAMVVSEGQPQDVQNGRFARQTGRAVVVDDKHMCVLPPNDIPGFPAQN